MRGSIRERGPDIWELRIYLGHGRQRSKRVRGSRREAEKVLARFVADNPTADTASGTVAALLVDWLEHCARTAKHTPATTRDRTAIVHGILIPAWGALPLHRLGPRDLDRQYAAWLAEGASAGTVHRRHEIMRAAFAQAVKWRMISTNPATNATPPSAPTVRRHATKLPDLVETVRRLAVTHPDTAALLQVAATTGARRGELLAVRWERLDLDTGTLAISERLSAGVLLPATKNGTVRTIALDPFTVGVLRSQRTRVLERALSIGARVTGRCFVWASDPEGTIPVDPASVTTLMSRWRRTTGLEVRMHELRHLAATLMIGSGADMRTASGRLGHARTSMTADGYADWVPVNDRAAANMLGSTIEAALGG